MAVSEVGSSELFFFNILTSLSALKNSPLLIADIEKQGFQVSS
jgi:hypothetical protein